MNELGMNGPNSQVLIVYRKQEAPYAHLMAQLISSYAGYIVGEWEEKDWRDNKAKSASSEHIIFLGETGKEYKLGTKWQFDEFGMRFGWLGKKCICEVSPLPSEKAQAFIAHYESRSKHYEIETQQKKVIGKPLPPAAKAILMLNPVGIAFLGTKAKVEIAQLIKQQFQLLAYEFVFTGGIKSFMEAK